MFAAGFYRTHAKRTGKAQNKCLCTEGSASTTVLQAVTPSAAYGRPPKPQPVVIQPPGPPLLQYQDKPRPASFAQAIVHGRRSMCVAPGKRAFRGAPCPSPPGGVGLLPRWTRMPSPPPESTSPCRTCSTGPRTAPCTSSALRWAWVDSGWPATCGGALCTSRTTMGWQYRPTRSALMIFLHQTHGTAS